MTPSSPGYGPIVSPLPIEVATTLRNRPAAGGHGCLPAYGHLVADHDRVPNAGAVTWATGITDMVSASNSLVGTNNDASIGN